MQCSHLVALSELELNALHAAMYGITRDAWRLTHPQIAAVSACRIRIDGIFALHRNSCFVCDTDDSSTNRFAFNFIVHEIIPLDTRLDK